MSFIKNFTDLIRAKFMLTEAEIIEPNTLAQKAYSNMIGARTMETRKVRK